MSKIITLQDFSCFGKCSLTIALPVLSAMGQECIPVPTAILSAHTAFPNPYVVDLSPHIQPIYEYLSRLETNFSGILTGYLANAGQVATAKKLIRTFRTEKTTVVVDPAMADDGALYPGLQEDMIPAMLELCRMSDLAVPNITEGCLMAGMPVPDTPDEGFSRELGQELLNLGIPSVMLTGTELISGQIGFYWSDRNISFFHSGNKIPRSRPGTGDLFSACLMGGLMRGLSPQEAGILAGEFVRRSICATDADCWYSVAFEQELPWLISQL